MSWRWRPVKGRVSLVTYPEPRVSWGEDLDTPGHHTALGLAVAIRGPGAEDTGKCCHELLEPFEQHYLVFFIFHRLFWYSVFDTFSKTKNLWSSLIFPENTVTEAVCGDMPGVTARVTFVKTSSSVTRGNARRTSSSVTNLACVLTPP